MRIFSNLFGKNDKNKKNTKNNTDEGSNSNEDKVPVKSKIDENLKYIKEKLKDCDDVIYRDIWVGEKQQYKMSLIYVDGLVDKQLINDHVMHSLMLDARQAKPSVEELKGNLYEVIKKATITGGDIKEIDDLDKCITSILSGDTALFFDGYPKIVIISSKGWQMRSVMAPETEMVVRGAREGFTETIRVNTALVRRWIRDPEFKIKQMQIGKRSKTDVAVLYIDDIVNKDLLNEVIKRLKEIVIDGVIESGYIEQLIEEDWHSPFPQILNTERPDKVAASVLEGRIAILVDNSPFALIIPAAFATLFQSPEDYFERWMIASLLRILRFTAALVALLAPALYIAFIEYHPGMIPTKLALYIAATRQGVPFPAFLEALIMEATFELLREAGIRLPVPIGQTIGIVGGLIIGQAAVMAGIVSPLMVIVVAVTAVASFSIPSYSAAIAFRMLRFIFMILAAVFGLYGIMLGLIIVLTHLVVLKSFGQPYLSPFIEINMNDFADTLIRAPFMVLKNRPGSLNTKDKKRLKDLREEKMESIEEDRRESNDKKQ
ncbi:spore germination protein [Aceticella autotrophica]|uniref:Spore germination protein n=1 Tax=Aceticella autotrophica TaxID=2755338 RepID=A0A975AW01_9THEO|nr:spore germination protein [Aceticella autotrophica]QSZ27480.1 spore germination protein [Aceticella autotrophica]